MSDVPTYAAPRYVNEGDRVLIPWTSPEHPRRSLWVTVEKAAGYHAYVVNAAFNVARWSHIDNLLVLADDPRVK